MTLEIFGRAIQAAGGGSIITGLSLARDDARRDSSQCFSVRGESHRGVLIRAIVLILRATHKTGPGTVGGR
jgi:hypothetical protein